MITEQFRDFLKAENCAENTIRVYTDTCDYYIQNYKDFTIDNVLDYKVYLIENFAPKTVNLRIMALNKLLEFVKKSELKISTIKVPQEFYLDNLMSIEQYQLFKEKLLKNKRFTEYFAISLITSTGARISELIQFKITDIKNGYVDILSKGNKVRRLYIPEKLQKECNNWLIRFGIGSGYVFRNKFGNQISTRGLAYQIKKYGLLFGFPEKSLHPHAFRHLFAKLYLSKSNDIAMLADLMGHSSIETTRIYLRKSSNEQREMINQIVDW